MNGPLESTNIIITGVGGQGNVLAARLLASVALEEGYEVTVGDIYGLTQRGGAVASHVRWSQNEALSPIVPRGSLNILVAFEPMEALRVLCQFGNEETAALVNDAIVFPIGVQAGRFEYPDPSEMRDAIRSLSKYPMLLNAKSIAQKIGNEQVVNVVMMGVLFGSGFIDLSCEIFEKHLQAIVSHRYIDNNLSAFKEGVSIAKHSKIRSGQA